MTGPGEFIGILAGSNGGTISNVTVDGTVSAGPHQASSSAGGLVGQNGNSVPNSCMGAITLSNADVNVTVGNGGNFGASGNSAGGLVGNNPAAITDSFASGNVKLAAPTLLWAGWSG